MYRPILHNVIIILEVLLVALLLGPLQKYHVMMMMMMMNVNANANGRFIFICIHHNGRTIQQYNRKYIQDRRKTSYFI